MANGVVKALKQKHAWGQVRFVDDYLRGELEKQKEDGIVKTHDNLYSAVNSPRDNFTKTVMMEMKCYGTKKIKAYEYVQSFSGKDRENGLTAEAVHRCGVEFAYRFFGNYPVLVVTHIDTGNIHNQFLVGNVDVDTGHSLQIGKKELEKMKEITGRQCEERGWKYSLWEERPVKKKPWQMTTDAEHLMDAHGKATDKEQIAFMARRIIPSCDGMDDFMEKMKQQYGITVRMTANSISFVGEGMKRPIRGQRIAEDMTKEAIENGIELCKQRRDTERILGAAGLAGSHETGDGIPEEHVRKGRGIGGEGQDSRRDGFPAPGGAAGTEGRKSGAGRGEKEALRRERLPQGKERQPGNGDLGIEGKEQPSGKGAFEDPGLDEGIRGPRL